MTFVRGVFSLIFVAALTALCVGNPGSVAVRYSPFHEAAMLPLYIVILGTFLGGFLVGGSLVWLNGLSAGWRQRRTIKALEKTIKARDHEKALSSGSGHGSVEKADETPALSQSGS